MRWKLLLPASLLAALAGAFGIAGVSYLGDSFAATNSSPRLLVVARLLPAVAGITYAAMFVYRHTARRRKLQAALTVACSIVLLLAALMLIMIYVRH